MPCYFYVLQKSEKNGSYYKGYTCDDLTERVAKHNRPHKGHTRRHQPWRLLYSEAFDTKREAMAREKEVKSRKSRSMVEDLVQTLGA